MIGLGTIINVIGIIVGGILGLTCGRFVSETIRDGLNMACGVSVLFIGMAGGMQGMLSVGAGGAIESGNSMVIVISLVTGALVGELMGIEDKFERFGEWLKVKSRSTGDVLFVDAFVTASLTVCIGAMAIVGAIQDGIYGDYSTLTTKAILDLIIIMCMTCAMGKGCAFSAVPVAMLQGSITLLASLIKPLMTEGALFNISMVGSILIFCVGLNLVWGKKVKVANMLPALVTAVIFAFVLP